MDFRSPPSICTGCGRYRAGAAAEFLCDDCGATDEGTVWTLVPESLHDRVMRWLAAIGLWLVCPWGLVLLVLAFLDRPERWLSWGVTVLIALVLTLGGVLLSVMGIELACRRDWTFRSADGQRRGSIRALWGRILVGGGVIATRETVEIDLPAYLCSRAVAVMGLETFLARTLALLQGPTNTWVEWPVYPGDRRRPVDLAVLASLLGMAARGQLVLVLERVGGWHWVRAQRAPRPIAERVSLSLHRRPQDRGAKPEAVHERSLQAAITLGIEEGWLEQAVYARCTDQPQRVEEVVRDLVGTRLDPWSWLAEQLLRDAPLYWPIDHAALAAGMSAALAEHPQMTVALWREVDQALTASALNAHSLWRFSPDGRPDDASFVN